MSTQKDINNAPDYSSAPRSSQLNHTFHTSSVPDLTHSSGTNGNMMAYHGMGFDPVGDQAHNTFAPFEHNASVAEMENSSRYTSLDPTLDSPHHTSNSYSRMNAPLLLEDDLPDSLPVRNRNNTRPPSDLFLGAGADTGAPFQMIVGGGAQDGQYLTPIQVAEHDVDSNRPATAASADTYQKAQTMFTDFDGTHYASTIREGDEDDGENSPEFGSSRLMSQPPLIDKRIPPPAPGMVFYPAPVPKTLLLPQRLSRAMPAAEQAKRRSHMLAGLPNDARKSAIWLNQHNPITEHQISGPEGDAQRTKQRMSNLPPQLRASMYFENPSQLQEVEIRDTSAVATLEDLLDASTIAPVSAFTDHPFAGKAGGNIYKSEGGHKRKTSKGTPPRIEKRRSSMLGLRQTSIASTDALNAPPKVKKHSRAFSLSTLLDRGATCEVGDIEATSPSRSGVSTPIPNVQVNGAEEEEEGSSEEDPDFDMPSDDDDAFERIGPPTTLLAELQYRKHAQKQRNRTALSAFPNGMHSTLLEMDAVAQVQKKKRQNARVTLAWEDPDRVKANQNAADDDDLPLGMMLATGKNAKKDADWDQPMGLIQLRELEDNEPLAARKARLRGSEMFAGRPQSHFRSLSGTPMLQINGDALGADDPPEETLAQRVKRLKNQSPGGSSDGTRPLSQAISEELLAQQGDKADASNENTTVEDEEEETLGQRRARLQRESQRQSQINISGDGQGQDSSPQLQPARPPLRTSTSMADLLHNVPMGATRRVSEKNLLSNMPQNSLLKQSEDKRAAHVEMMTDIRNGNAHRSPSGQFGSRPLLDMTNVDANKHTIPNGYRGGMFNNGFGGVGVGPAPVQNAAMNQSMIDLRQSMALIAQQNQMALQMMAAQNQMMDPRMSMQMQQMQTPMQTQPVMPLNPHMSMPHMSMPSAGMMVMGGMPHGPGSMNMYSQSPMIGTGIPQQHLPGGAAAAASTPNLMMNTTSPRTSQLPAFQRHASMMAAIPVAASPQQDDAVYVEVNKQARIDAWRQDIQMGP